MGSEEELAELWLVSTTPFSVLFLSPSAHTHTQTHTKPGLLKYLTPDSLRVKHPAFTKGLTHCRGRVLLLSAEVGGLPSLLHPAHSHPGRQPPAPLGPVCSHPIYLGRSHSASPRGHVNQAYLSYLGPIKIPHDSKSSGTVP